MVEEWSMLRSKAFQISSLSNTLQCWKHIQQTNVPEAWAYQSNYFQGSKHPLATLQWDPHQARAKVNPGQMILLANDHGHVKESWEKVSSFWYVLWCVWCVRDSLFRQSVSVPLVAAVYHSKDIWCLGIFSFWTKKKSDTVHCPWHRSDCSPMGHVCLSLGKQRAWSWWFHEKYVKYINIWVILYIIYISYDVIWWVIPSKCWHHNWESWKPDTRTLRSIFFDHQAFFCTAKKV